MKTITVYLNVHQYCALRGDEVYTFAERWGITPMMEGSRDARGHYRSRYRLSGTRAAWEKFLPDAYRRAHQTQGRSAIRNAINIISRQLWEEA